MSGHAAHGKKIVQANAAHLEGFLLEVPRPGEACSKETVSHINIRRQDVRVRVRATHIRVIC